MIAFHIKVLLNRVFKPEKFTLINILGLSVAFASVLLIWLYVYNEISHDSFHNNRSQIFRLFIDSPIGKTSEINSAVSQKFKEDIPEILKIALINTHGMYFSDNLKIRYGDKEIDNLNLFYANKDFADIFSFKTLDGDLNLTLTERNSIAITKSVSTKLFGEASAYGKQLIVNDTIFLTVRAVLADVPDNSSIKFDGLLPFSLCKELTKVDLENDENCSCDSYFLLGKNTDKNEVIKKIRHSIFNIMGGNKEAEGMLSQVKVDLVPLSKLHFSTPIDYDHIVHGNRNYVLTLFFVGLGILILAIINFINIDIARNFESSKDTGVKKVMGAGDFSLVSQLHIPAISDTKSR